MDAALELGKLGDATGLALWQTTEGLWPAELKLRRERLVRLSSESPAAVHEQAEALLAAMESP